MILLLSLFATAAVAQDKPAEVPPKVGVHSERFATIAGGWWLERRCAFLDEAERRAFETLIAQVSKAMQQTYGADWTQRLQRAAKEAADPLPCEDAARAIVEASSEMVVPLNSDLGGLDYNPETSYRRYLEQRLTGIAAAVGLAERCRYGPGEARLEFATLFQRLAAKTAETWHRPTLPGRLEAIRSQIASGGGPACSDRNQAAVLTALQDARALGIEQDLWSQETGLIE